MNEFDNGGEVVVVLALVAQGASDEQNQHRPQAFATTIDDVFGHLPNQYYVGVEAVADDRIHGFHVRPDQGIELLKRHGIRLVWSGKATNGRWGGRGRQGGEIKDFPALTLLALIFAAVDTKFGNFAGYGITTDTQCLGGFDAAPTRMGQCARDQESLESLGKQAVYIGDATG